MSLNDIPRPMPIRRKLAFGALAALLTFFLAEAVVSVAATRMPPSVYWLFEGKGPRVYFDAVSGYRMHGGPARVAKFVRAKGPFRAEAEYVGGFLANSDGYPDRDDFHVTRTEPGTTRLAVLGDSFTGGDLILHWPDACEDEVRTRGGSAELLNFSLSGIGLANWHSILTRGIEPGGYRLDGVVFAVWDNDLARRFYVCDHEGTTRRLGGRVDSWDPADYPRTRDEALRFMSTWQAWIVPPQDFEAAIRGDWKPERPLRPFLTNALLDRMRPAPPDGGRVGAAVPGTLAADLANTERGRGRLVREMKEALDRMGVPVVVVRIPTIEELADRAPAPAEPDARAFADFLGARYLDGAQAFAGLTPQQARENWYPVDLHWNQTGSDRFARWMAAEVLRWPVRDGAVQADAGGDRRTGAR